MDFIEKETAIFAEELEKLLDQKLNQRFEKARLELNLPSNKIFSQREKKNILLQKHINFKIAYQQGQKTDMEYVEDIVKNILKPDLLIKTLESLRIALTNYERSWLNSTSRVIDILINTFVVGINQKNDQISYECLRCLSQIIPFKMMVFLSDFSWLEAITRRLDNNAIKSMEESIKILLIITQAGYVDHVLDAIYYAGKNNSQPPFLPIINGIIKSPQRKVNEICFKLINCILEKIDVLEERLKFRYEILQLDSLNDEKLLEPALKPYYDNFIKSKTEDLATFQNELQALKVNTGNIQKCFDVLYNTIIDKDACLAVIKQLIDEKRDKIRAIGKVENDQVSNNNTENKVSIRKCTDGIEKGRDKVRKIDKKRDNVVEKRVIALPARKQG